MAVLKLLYRLSSTYEYKPHAWPQLVIGECQCHDIRRLQCDGDGPAHCFVLEIWWKFCGYWIGLYMPELQAWPQLVIGEYQCHDIKRQQRGGCTVKHRSLCVLLEYYMYVCI